MKRLIFATLVAGSLAVAPEAEAAFLTGGFSIVAANGVTPYNGPGYTNPTQDISTANVLDFGSNGAGTGAWAPTSCSGSFVAVLSPCTLSPLGTIKDLDVTSGVGALVIPSFMTGANGLILNLSSVFLIDRGIANQLTMLGFGTVIANGFEVTPVTWNFTGNSAAGTFSWSSSQGAIPEPGNLVLLGTGLLGLAAAARRMRKGRAAGKVENEPKVLQRADFRRKTER